MRWSTMFGFTSWRLGKAQRQLDTLRPQFARVLKHHYRLAAKLAGRGATIRRLLDELGTTRERIETLRKDALRGEKAAEALSRRLRDQLGQLRRAYTHWITAALGDRGRMEEAEDKAERLRAELQEKTDWLAKIERALDGWQTRVRGTPPVGGNAMDRIRVLTAAWRGEREQHSAEADTLRAQLEAYKRSLAVIAEAAKNLDEEPTPDETPGLVQCAARESEKCSPRGEPGCDHYEPHKLRDDCAGEASFCPTHGNNVKCSPVKEPAKTIQTTVRCFRHSDAELGIHRRGVWLMTRGSGPRGTFFYGDRNVSEAPAWDVEELAEMAADPNGSGMRVEEILPAEAIKELTSWPEGQEEARRIFARHPKTKPPPSDHGKDASRLCEPMLARSGG